MSWNRRDLQRVVAGADRDPIAAGAGKTLPIAMRGALAAIALYVAAFSGCARERQPQRLALEGTVTLDGKPLMDGSIRFLPVDSTPGGMVAARIEGGRFTLAAQQGAVAGKYRVEIGASRKTGRKVPDPSAQQPIDEVEQFLPERYNSQSTLTAEVTEARPNQFEFPLSLK